MQRGVETGHQAPRLDERDAFRRSRAQDGEVACHLCARELVISLCSRTEEGRGAEGGSRDARTPTAPPPTITTLVASPSLRWLFLRYSTPSRFVPDPGIVPGGDSLVPVASTRASYSSWLEGEEEGRETGRSRRSLLEGRRERAWAWRTRWGGGSIEWVGVEEEDGVENGMNAACSCEGEIAKRGYANLTPSRAISVRQPTREREREERERAQVPKVRVLLDDDDAMRVAEHGAELFRDGETDVRRTDDDDVLSAGGHHAAGRDRRARRAEEGGGGQGESECEC